MLKIYPVETEEDIKIVKLLFVEYADCLEFNLCFQNFEEELAGLPENYAPPKRCILLAEYENTIAGCVAIREFDDGICEMKRLYVKPQFHGRKIGKALAEAVIAKAQSIGYDSMRLDFVTPRVAESLYRSLGFKEISPYENIPVPNAVFMELKL